MYDYKECYVTLGGKKVLVVTQRWAEAHQMRVYFTWDCVGAIGAPEPLVCVTYLYQGDWAQMAGIADTCFDWARPQDWADQHPDWDHYVWSYAKARLFGEPLNLYQLVRDLAPQVQAQFTGDPVGYPD